MNIEKAKGIPVAKILEKLNLHPVRSNEKEAWYLSPFRQEKTPSFHVHNHKNLWFDFGEAKGGDVIKLVQALLEQQGKDNSVSFALKWLDSSIDGTIDYQPPQPQDEGEHTPVLTLKSATPIKNIALKQYLEKRGIPFAVASKVLKEIRFTNDKSGKTIFALGLVNEEEGYELRNSFFKGCIGQKSISFVRGSQPKPSGINIFEGMMDYLSIITQRNGQPLTNDTIILNSINCIKQVAPYVKDYGYQFGYTWMDNDLAGKKAIPKLLEIFKAENIAHCPMNRLYEPYKDVNASHMAKLEL